MRGLLSLLFAALLITETSSGQAAVSPAEQFSSVERLMRWTFTYRIRAEPQRLPAAVESMYDLGLLDNQDKTGYFIGFIAGVLNQNPKSATSLIERMLPLPPKEQAAVIKAIAYSELSNWPELLLKISPRMPERQILIDDFLSGVEPELMLAPLNAEHVIYTLWGFYVATGDVRPVERLISALAWAEGGEPSAFSWERIGVAFGWGGDEYQQTLLDRAVIASIAKWTLVSYAEHHRDLVEHYRTQIHLQPETVSEQLGEVLEAAERFEADRVREEEAAKIEALRQRMARTGSYGSRAAYAGSVGLATACVIAGALGHPEIAVPCVVTGALYSGTMKIFEW